MDPVFVFTVTSVNNPDDDGAAVYGYEPMHLLEVWADKDSAMIRAQAWVDEFVAEQKAEAEEREGALKVDGRSAPDKRVILSVTVENWHTIYRACVSREEVREHIPAQ
jgi:hypothetical protein